MPVLTNAKHELFAQEIAKGATATDAYERAGYKRNDGNASKLANTKDVKARVEELNAKAADAAVVSKTEVLLELKKLGFSNMLDYIRVQDGDPVLDFSKLTRDQAAAISEVVVETRLERVNGDDTEPAQVKKVRFKLAPKHAPLVDLGKAVGITFKETVEHSVDDPLKQLLAELAGTAFRPVETPPKGK